METDKPWSCRAHLKTLRILSAPQLIKVRFSQYDSVFLCLDFISCLPNRADSLCRHNESCLQYKPPAVKLGWDTMYSLPPTSVTKTLINSSSTARLCDFNLFIFTIYILCSVSLLKAVHEVSLGFGAYL